MSPRWGTGWRSTFSGGQDQHPDSEDVVQSTSDATENKYHRSWQAEDLSILWPEGQPGHWCWGRSPHLGPGFLALTVSCPQRLWNLSMDSHPPPQRQFGHC